MNTEPDSDEDQIDDVDEKGNAFKGVYPKLDDNGKVVSQGVEDDMDETTGYSYQLDREHDDTYNRYLVHTTNNVANSGTLMAKRIKSAVNNKAFEQAKEIVGA